jgi:hypothetical protein
MRRKFSAHFSYLPRRQDNPVNPDTSRMPACASAERFARLTRVVTMNGCIFTNPWQRGIKRRFFARWLSHIGVYANSSTFVVYDL